MSEALSEGEERFLDLLALSRSDECAPAMLYCVEHRHVVVLNRCSTSHCASCLGGVEQCSQLGVQHVEHLPRGGVNVEQLNTC